jgi:hypothetical protein
MAAINDLAESGESRSMITDHDYVPQNVLEPWGTCGHRVGGERTPEGACEGQRPCGLAEAAHARAAIPYRPKL